MSNRFTLTPFQTEKLEYFFKFFAPNDNNELVQESLTNFMERILTFTGWARDSADARECHEVHEAFFEILFDKASDGESKRAKCISLEDWLALWSHLIPGCTGLYNFPIWLRLLPKTIFRIMDRDHDNLITEDELGLFYQGMVNLTPEEAKKNSKLAYAQMTDNGYYPLNLNSYEQIFSNFMLGRTPYGPGRHIFGCFEHDVDITPFTLIAPAPEEDDVDIKVKIYKEKRPKRMSLSEGM